MYIHVYISTYPTDFAHIWVISQTLLFIKDKFCWLRMITHDYAESIVLKVIISKTFWLSHDYLDNDFIWIIFSLTVSWRSRGRITSLCVVKISLPNTQLLEWDSEKKIWLRISDLKTVVLESEEVLDLEFQSKAFLFNVPLPPPLLSIHLSPPFRSVFSLPNTTDTDNWFYRSSDLV